MCAQFLPADHSKGDPNTIGGYAAVHDRPAAFEGSDGFSYSVEMMVEPTGDASGTWGAFFLFVKWARVGAQSPEGHLETPYLFYARSEEDARRMAGQLPLNAVKKLLDGLIAARAQSSRPWWEAMNDEESI